jgi:putative transposase
VEVKKVAVRAPNQNAHAERFVQSVKQECLDHFLVFGEAHLRHIVTEYVQHHNEERPHQALGNEPPGGLPPMGDGPATISLSEVRCRRRLGGLLKHYHRVAA